MNGILILMRKIVTPNLIIIIYQTNQINNFKKTTSINNVTSQIQYLLRNIYPLEMSLLGVIVLFTLRTLSLLARLQQVYPAHHLENLALSLKNHIVHQIHSTHLLFALQVLAQQKKITLLQLQITVEKL